MMGERTAAEEPLSYESRLEWHVPADLLLRSVNRFVDLSGIHEQLRLYYSEMGRPSIDPELMIPMLIFGYCIGVRSERRLCDEVHLNLAYRWFCRLGLDGDVPDHSTFSTTRHGRFLHWAADDIELGMDLVRNAQEMRKDFVYAGFALDQDDEPESLAVVIREVLTVDVVDRCFLWAADETTPLVIVSTRANACFVVRARGLLMLSAPKHSEREPLPTQLRSASVDRISDGTLAGMTYDREAVTLVPGTT